MAAAGVPAFGIWEGHTEGPTSIIPQCCDTARKSWPRELAEECGGNDRACALYISEPAQPVPRFSVRLGSTVRGLIMGSGFISVVGKCRRILLVDFLALVISEGVPCSGLVEEGNGGRRVLAQSLFQFG